MEEGPFSMGEGGIDLGPLTAGSGVDRRGAARAEILQMPYITITACL